MPVEKRTRIEPDSPDCLAPIPGCTAPDAINYDASATVDDASCLWGSDLQGGVFTKNDCKTGSGSNVDYFAPVNQKTSTVSKADANAQRDAVFASNGQINANFFGTCSSPMPDPRFAGEIICRFFAPRQNSETKQRKQDSNRASASFGQWLKQDGSYTSNQNDGFFFLTGNSDSNLCPYTKVASVKLSYRDFNNNTASFPFDSVGKAELRYKSDGKDYAVLIDNSFPYKEVNADVGSFVDVIAYASTTNIVYDNMTINGVKETSAYYSGQVSQELKIEVFFKSAPTQA